MYRLRQRNHLRVSGGGGLVCESLGKALLSGNFNREQPRTSVDLQLPSLPSPSHIYFSFRSSGMPSG